MLSISAVRQWRPLSVGILNDTPDRGASSLEFQSSQRQDAPVRDSSTRTLPKLITLWVSLLCNARTLRGCLTFSAERIHRKPTPCLRAQSCPLAVALRYTHITQSHITMCVQIICMRIHVYICIYMCIIYMCVCVYIYIYIYVWWCTFSDSTFGSQGS